QIGKPPLPAKQFQLEITAKGRLVDEKEFADLIIKTDGKKAVVRLKDVARTELGAAADSYVSLNGKPAVILGVYPLGTTNPKRLSEAIAAKIAELRERMPKGLRLEVSFDFTANLEAPAGQKAAEFLLLDVHSPEATSWERRRDTLTRCEKLLREVAEVQD